MDQLFIQSIVWSYGMIIHNELHKKFDQILKNMLFNDKNNSFLKVTTQEITKNCSFYELVFDQDE